MPRAALVLRRGLGSDFDRTRPFAGRRCATVVLKSVPTARAGRARGALTRSCVHPATAMACATDSTVSQESGAMIFATWGAKMESMTAMIPAWVSP